MTIRGRKRAFNGGSTSSEFFNVASGQCSVEYLYGMKDVYRVAPTGKLPMLWPYLASTYNTSPAAKQLAEQLKEPIMRILAQSGINIRRHTVVTLCRSGLTDTKRDTLILDASDNPQNNSRWHRAADRIQEVIDQAIADQNSTISLRVEIRNSELMYQPRYFTVPSNTELYEKLSKSQLAIHDKILQLIPNAWKTISFSDLGSKENRRTTLLIGIKPGTFMDWVFIEDALSQGLAELQLAGPDIPLDFEFIPSTFNPASQTLDAKKTNPRTLYLLPERAPNGFSISARGVKDEAGSFGFWVDWIPKNQNQKRKAFMTCYHVIENAAVGETRRENHNYGINERSQPIYVDYPAASDAIVTKKTLEENIRKGEDPDGEKRKVLDIIDRYDKQGGIGQVRFASGRMINGNKTRMDWMLAELIKESDFGANQAPPGPFTNSQLLNDQIKYQPPHPTAKVSRTAQMSHKHLENWVAKVGRTTGLTAGEVQGSEENGLKAKIAWADGLSSLEILVHDINGLDFADYGDSGSMVVNKDKKVVGMVIGVLKGPTQTIVTPIEEIFQDVFDAGAGRVSLP